MPFKKFKKTWVEWHDEVLSYAVRDDQLIDRLGLPVEKVRSKQNFFCPSCQKQPKKSAHKKGFSPDRGTDRVAIACASTHCNFYAHSIIDAIHKLEGVDKTELLRELSDRYGVEYEGKGERKGTSKPIKPWVAPKREPVAGRDFDDPEGISDVLEVAQNLQNVHPGDPVDLYLVSRGINYFTLPKETQSSVLKSTVKWGKEGKEYTIMACPVVAADNGDVIAYHRTFLTKDGKKAFKNAKLMTKAIRDSALTNRQARIKLASPRHGVLCFAEGVETALILIQAGYPVVSTIDAFKLKTQKLPPGVHHVVIFADLDKSNTGQQEAALASQAFRKANPNVKVDILLPPENLWDKEDNPKGIDWQDVLSANPKALG